MAWTQEDLTRLERAIATGARRVAYADGKSVDYRTLADMFAIRDVILAALGLAGRPMRKVMAHNKGLNPGSLNREEWQ